MARFVAFLIFFLNKDYFLLIYFDELLHEFCDMWLFWQGFFFYIKGFFFSIKKFWNVFRVKLKQGLLWQKFENHYIVLAPHLVLGLSENDICKMNKFFGFSLHQVTLVKKRGAAVALAHGW